MIYQILPEFVEEIPKEIDDGYLYLCLPYNAVIHKCACGCGEIISTPLDKKYGWVMKYDGQAITLRPSIGNFSIPCRSHYYITDNNVEWLESYQQKNNKKGLFERIKQLFKK